MLIRSIRLRLTAWYAVTLAAALAASSIFWYVALSRNLQNHVDEKLLEVARSVELQHITQHRGIEVDKACAGLDAYIISHSWAGYAQVRNSLGNLLCVINGVNGTPLPLGKQSLLNITRGMAHFETVDKLSSTPIRMLSLPVIEDGKLQRIIQVAQSLENIRHTMSDLRTIFNTLSPFVIIVLTLGGWFLAQRALSPIIQINDMARRITAENLNERLPVGEVHDELANLSETINSMLSRLEDSFRRIKQFSADASHELRTPLAILKGETEVSLRWAKSDQELRNTLSSNLEEINLMSRILEDLLALASSEAGELHLDINPFSLSDLLQDIYLHGKTLSEEKKHIIRLHLQVESEIHMAGDQIQLYRMLLNLVSNSIKYTPPGGVIDITLEVHDRKACIEISDSGVGISEEHQKHIFDRFYRIDAARNRADGGTGLGLSIAKAIVDAHDGEISVSSTLGQGATFRILLPLDGPHIEI